MSDFVEDDVAAYLESQLSWLKRQSNVGNVPGQQNFFLGDIPADSPAESVGIYQYPGMGTEYFLGSASSKKKIEKPRVQFTVRAARYDRARKLANDIFNALEDVGPVSLGNPQTVYLIFRSIARPTEVAPDSENRSQFTVGFTAWRQN